MWWLFLPLAALAYFGLDAGGLFVNRDLAACLDQSEQTTLLRPMALTGKAKDAIDYCLGEMTWFASRQVRRDDWRRGLYVNANRPVQACMFRKGYIIAQHRLTKYRQVGPDFGRQNAALGYHDREALELLARPGGLGIDHGRAS
jgi:hypothetical protein